MSDARRPDPRSDEAWKDWMTQTVTITLPRWAYVAGGAVAVLLLMAALD